MTISTASRAAPHLDSPGLKRLPKRDHLSESTLDHKRAYLKFLLQTIYQASDDFHDRVRELRKLILLGAFAVTLFVCAAVCLSWWLDFTPFCFSPSDEEFLVACPSGEYTELPANSSSFQDAAIVASLGVLGGALAAALTIRRLPTTSTPFDVPLALALLKVPMGALTALAGMLLLAGEFVPGLSDLDSQQQILAYALVLGYAQQMFTRFVDNQARVVLDSQPRRGEQRQHSDQRPPNGSKVNHKSSTYESTLVEYVE